MDGRTRFAPLVLGASVLLSAACGAASDVSNGSSPSTTAPPVTSDEVSGDDGAGASRCGGDEHGDAKASGSAAPQAVRDAMASVREAAQRCDVDRLAAIALGDNLFTASFGTDFPDAAALARYWLEAETGGRTDITGLLVRLLAMRPVAQVATSAAGKRQTLWVVPAAHARPDDGEARAELAERFGDHVVAGWFRNGEYLGPRAGFTATGAWRFFIPGGD